MEDLKKKREAFIKHLEECDLFTKKEIETILKKHDRLAKEEIIAVGTYDFDFLQFQYPEKFELIDIDYQ